MITDAHAHISDSDYGNIGIYLEQMKQAGIAQAVLVPGGMMDVRKMTEYIIGRSKPENPIPNNDYVLNSMKANPQTLKGFMCIDPHASDAVAKLEQGIRGGFTGLKFNPTTHQFSFASKAVADLVSACGSHGVPVYTHVMFNPGASTEKFIALAKQFPRVNFILGHMGFGPADVEGLEAAAKLNNFYLETSTGNYLHIKEAVKKAGPGKLIYGSEFPLSHPKAELEKILLLDVSDDAKSKILDGNIRALLSGATKSSQSSGQVSKPKTGSSYGNYRPGYGRVTD